MNKEKKRDLNIVFKQHLNPLLVLAQTIENRKKVIKSFEGETNIHKRISDLKMIEIKNNLISFEMELSEYIEDFKNSEHGLPLMTTEEKLKIGII